MYFPVAAAPRDLHSPPPRRCSAFSLSRVVPPLIDSLRNNHCFRVFLGLPPPAPPRLLTTMGTGKPLGLAVFSYVLLGEYSLLTK